MSEHVHVWGVDVAMAKLAFAFADTESPRVEVASLRMRTEDREGARLGLIDRKVRIYAAAVARQFPPACVWVEQPSGRFPKPQLYYCAGVTMAALFETLACPVWSIPPKTWKQRTVGSGNATKAHVRAWVDSLGLEVDSQDEADAVAIACAGRAMLLSRSWEATAA